jgi:hypothetical protein
MNISTESFKELIKLTFNQNYKLCLDDTNQDSVFMEDKLDTDNTKEWKIITVSAPASSNENNGIVICLVINKIVNNKSLDNDNLNFYFDATDINCFRSLIAIEILKMHTGEN